MKASTRLFVALATLAAGQGTAKNPGLQGVLELIGGLMIALGLFTRTVAFILAGNMAVAYFMVHSPRSFFPLLNGRELAIVYCFVFLYFWVAGGGEWSLDRLRTPASSVRLITEPRLNIIGCHSVLWLGVARHGSRRCRLQPTGAGGAPLRG